MLKFIGWMVVFVIVLTIATCSVAVVERNKQDQLCGEPGYGNRPVCLRSDQLARKCRHESYRFRYPEACSAVSKR